MLANSNYSDRVDSGKRVEKKILDSLRQKGYKILDPTAQEDMKDKIDGWWIDKQGNEYPVQVKFRQSGDDILYELTADVDRKIEGRDLKSKADLYLVSDRSGTTRMFLTKPIKEKAKSILSDIQKDLQINPRKTNWEGSGWQVRVQYDRNDGHKKIVAYFSPRLFQALATWELSLNEITFKSFFG